MKEYSIFVDESGDFGKYAKHSPYYIVSIEIHKIFPAKTCTTACKVESLLHHFQPRNSWDE